MSWHFQTKSRDGELIRPMLPQYGTIPDCPEKLLRLSVISRGQSRSGDLRGLRRTTDEPSTESQMACARLARWFGEQVSHTAQVEGSKALDET